MQPMPIMILIFGVTLILAMIAFAFTGPNPAREASRRLQAVKLRHSDSALDKVEAQYRKAVAARKPTTFRADGQKSRREALRLRLLRTGKGWTVQQYTTWSIGLLVAITLLIWLKSGSLVFGLAVGVVIGAGLPHMVVNWHVGIRLGRTMEEALQDAADRLNIAEFSFFCITLAIQRETGGNLAETLAGLADVLRKRAQMKLKIKAMSSESKASAYIIGSLPFIVFALIYSINPKYMGRFFIDERLIGTGIGAFVWLSLGAFIMSRMINFEI